MILLASATLLKYLTVFLLSTVKFIGGPLAGIALDMPLFPTMAMTAAGMMSSVLVFSMIGRPVYKWYVARRRRNNKNIFTKNSRRIVKIWQRFGLAGIALFTPLIFTPIIGTLLAVVLGASRPKILLYMLVSAVLWSVAFTLLLYGLSDVLNIDVSIDNIM